MAPLSLTEIVQLAAAGSSSDNSAPRLSSSIPSAVSGGVSGKPSKTASSQQPAKSAVAQQTIKPSTSMTQDQRDDASVRELRALAASAGLKGFGEPDATNAASEADDLLSLAATVGLTGFARQEGQR